MKFAACAAAMPDVQIFRGQSRALHALMSKRMRSACYPRERVLKKVRTVLRRRCPRSALSEIPNAMRIASKRGHRANPGMTSCVYRQSRGSIRENPLGLAAFTGG